MTAIHWFVLGVVAFYAVLIVSGRPERRAWSTSAMPQDEHWETEAERHDL